MTFSATLLILIAAVWFANAVLDGVTLRACAGAAAVISPVIVPIAALVIVALVARLDVRAIAGT